MRQTEQRVQRLQKPQNRSQAQAKTDPNVRHLENELSDRLGAAISIQCGAKGKGRLIIQYESLEQLDGILSHIR